MDFSRIENLKNYDLRGCDPADRNFCHLWITEISEPSEFFQNFFLKSRFFKISTFDFFNEGGAGGQKFLSDVIPLD